MTSIPPIAEISLPRAAPLQFIAGMSYPVRALWYLQRQRLWYLAALPVGVNLVLLAALALLAWYEVWPWLQMMAERLQTMAGDGSSIATAVTVLTWVVWLILFPVAWIVSAVFVLLLGHVVASPFVELLSERVECTELHTEPAPFGLRRLFDAVVLALGDAVWGVIYLAVIYIPLIFLSLVPGVGAAVSIGCGALLLAQEFVGLSMARHFISYRARWRLVLRNKWFCGGFGFTATMTWLLPGLNILLLPVLAVGGTLLYCDLLRSGCLHDPEQALVPPTPPPANRA